MTTMSVEKPQDSPAKRPSQGFFSNFMKSFSSLNNDDAVHLGGETSPKSLATEPESESDFSGSDRSPPPPPTEDAKTDDDSSDEEGPQDGGRFASVEDSPDSTSQPFQKRSSFMAMFANSQEELPEAEPAEEGQKEDDNEEKKEEEVVTSDVAIEKEQDVATDETPDDASVEVKQAPPADKRGSSGFFDFFFKPKEETQTVAPSTTQETEETTEAVDNNSDNLPADDVDVQAKEKEYEPPAESFSSPAEDTKDAPVTEETKEGNNEKELSLEDAEQTAEDDPEPAPVVVVENEKDASLSTPRRESFFGRLFQRKEALPHPKTSDDTASQMAKAELPAEEPPSDDPPASQLAESELPTSNETTIAEEVAIDATPADDSASPVDEKELPNEIEKAVAAETDKEEEKTEEKKPKEETSFFFGLFKGKADSSAEKVVEVPATIAVTEDSTPDEVKVSEDVVVPAEEVVNDIIKPTESKEESDDLATSVRSTSGKKRSSFMAMFLDSPVKEDGDKLKETQEVEASNTPSGEQEVEFPTEIAADSDKTDDTKEAEANDMATSVRSTPSKKRSGFMALFLGSPAKDARPNDEDEKVDEPAADSEETKEQVDEVPETVNEIVSDDNDALVRDEEQVPVEEEPIPTSVKIDVEARELMFDVDQNGLEMETEDAAVATPLPLEDPYYDDNNTMDKKEQTCCFLFRR